MPYIVTTRQPAIQTRVGGLTETHGYRLDRRAVATLDDVRHCLLMAIEPGAPITLSDGTIIEVESVPWSGSDGMYALAGWTGTGPFDADPIDAYNAAQRQED